MYKREYVPANQTSMYLVVQYNTVTMLWRNISRVPILHVARYIHIYNDKEILVPHGTA